MAAFLALTFCPMWIWEGSGRTRKRGWEMGSPDRLYGLRLGPCDLPVSLNVAAIRA